MLSYTGIGTEKQQLEKTRHGKQQRVNYNDVTGKIKLKLKLFFLKQWKHFSSYL